MRVALPELQFGRGVERAVLQMGLTAEADLVTESESLLKLAFRRFRRSISLAAN